MIKLFYNGQKKLFRGSLDWQISISFKSDLSLFIVEFYNKQTKLLNSFEVNDLCSCVQLMNRFALGYQISIFDRRLSNWMSEYFNEAKQNIDEQMILRCLKDNEQKKLNVKVKKLTDIQQRFIELIQFDLRDLELDFNDIYQNIPIINMRYEDSYLLEKNEIPEEFKPNLNVVTKTFFKIENKEQTSEIISTLEMVNDPGNLILKKEVKNNFNITLNDLVIEDIITYDKKLIKLQALLVDQYQSIISRFQPLELIIGDNALKILWRVESLEIGHTIIFEYELRPILLNIITIQDDNNHISSFFHYSDIVMDQEKKIFSITLSNTQYITKKAIISIESYLPIYFSLFQTQDKKKQFTRSIHQEKHIQIIKWNEKVSENLKSQNLKFSGEILPIDYNFQQSEIFWTEEEPLTSSKGLIHSPSEKFENSDNKTLLETEIRILHTIQKKESLEEKEENVFPLTTKLPLSDTEKLGSLEPKNQSILLSEETAVIKQFKLQTSIGQTYTKMNDDQGLNDELKGRTLQEKNMNDSNSSNQLITPQQANNIRMEGMENEITLKDSKTLETEYTQPDNLIEKEQGLSSLNHKKVHEIPSKVIVEPQKLEKDSQFMEFIIVPENQNDLIQISMTENDKILVDDFIIAESFHNIEKDLQLPLRFWIKLPKKERFKIMLFNPNEMNSSHIDGFWKEKYQQQRFRLPIHGINGLWLLKIQFLESGKNWEYHIFYDGIK